MGVFDRLQNYSSRRGLNESSEVFDVNTPEGAFLNRVHNEGYAMYKIKHRLMDEFQLDEATLSALDSDSLKKYEDSIIIDNEAYEGLDDLAKVQYEKYVEFTELHDALTTSGNQIINAIAGSGKALVNGTGVRVKGGYQKIEELQIGDEVFGSDGKLHRVIGVYPQGRNIVYKVAFYNGVDYHYIYCNGEHLWSINYDGHIGVAETLTTVQLLDKYGDHNGCIHEVYVPKVEDLDFGGTGKLEYVPYEFDLTSNREVISYRNKDSIRNRQATFDCLLSNTNNGDIVSFYNGLSVKFTCSEVNYKNFVDLCESLGYFCCVDRDEDSDFYDVFVTYLATGYLLCKIEKLDYEQEMTCIEIDSPDHLYLTEHCIPTHNTTSLVFKILHDIVTGESMTLRSVPNGNQVRVANNVWVCTFLKSGAKELEQALMKWQKGLGYSQTYNQLNFSTMDAEFKRCLIAMGVATNIGEAGKLHSLLCKAVDSCNITRNGKNLTKEDYQIISGIVVYYRGRLDEKRYQHPSCKDYDITPTILDLIVRQYADLRKAAGIMDFEEIMELLYKYLYVTPNPAVQDFVANRYNFIYIDEFQDTSQMAYAILKFYARGHLWMNCSGEPCSDNTGLYTGTQTVGKLVVVGDVSQCYHPSSEILLEGNRSEKVCKVSTLDGVATHTGAIDPVTDIVTSDYDGELLKITTENGDVTVTPNHVFFELTEFNAYNHGSTVVYNLSGVDYSHTVFCSDGNTYYFKSYEGVDAFVQSFWGRYGRFEYLYYFNDNYYKEIRAYGINPSSTVLAMCDVRGYVSPRKVLGVETIKYKGLVYDVNTKSHVYVTSCGLVTHNCIYSFRGSDSHILSEHIEDDFRPHVSCLSVNWRCPENILNPVVPSIHKNWDSASQVIKASNKGGEFKALAFSSYKLMIKRLKEDIMRDMEDNYKVGILCRTNFDGLIPAFVLEADGRFDFGISGENMTLSSPLPRKIIGVASLFTERATPAVKNALAFFLPRGGDWQLKRLMEILKANNMSVWQIPKADIDYSCPALSDFIDSIKNIIMPDGVHRDKSKELEALRAIYSIMIVDTFAGDSAYCESARAYIETLLYLIESNDFKTIHEFLEEVDFLNDKLTGRIKKVNAPIQIATVHEFKGKERDSIYIWNDSDGTFPSSKCDIFNEEQLDEERRVHYIACTRAKKREHIYSLSDKVGMFVREMDLEIETVSNTSVTLPKHID